jgi:D-arabinose 1-dehydrogenase-like Zn-dependent alcohol dehydrogenase
MERHPMRQWGGAPSMHSRADVHSLEHEGRMTSSGTAALFVGNGKPFELRSYPIPSPEPGAIVARVSLANICGSDLHMWHAELDLERLRLPMPLCIGHEAVGEVSALGDGVTTDSAGAPLAIGDRISWRYFVPCGRCRACVAGKTRACQRCHAFISQGQSAEAAPHFVGAFATHYYIRPGQTTFKVPASVTDAAAAGANCALAEVIQGLTLAELRLGDTVVLQGAGGLGIFAAAVAKEMGAGRVIAIDSVAERLDLARDFGADETINLTDVTETRDRIRRVREATDGWGAEVVCEFVGNGGVVSEGIQMLAPGGRYLEIGCINRGTEVVLDPAHLTLLNRSVLGVVYYEPWALEAALAFLAHKHAAFPWDRLAGVRYGLDSIDRAFADAAAHVVPRAALDMTIH